MSLYASWVHGHQVQLERKGAASATGKSSVLNAFNGYYGDSINLGGSAAVACLRLGWGARFVVYDCGSRD